MIVKAFNLVFAAAFLLGAAVQFNDPDPWLWIPAYLVASACCIAFQRGRLNFRFGMGVALVAFLWSCTLLPTVIAHPPPWSDVFGDVKMYAPGVEEAREAGGLWLIAAWMLVLSWSARRAQSYGAPAGSGGVTPR